ncbi:hypothetical protein OIU91_19605 [Streptomyces sp. NBC_01456]|uniref:hypothetical protein n=1 Tax=unclassified Streptomyces TaxID=2593676 RepID=UPI002E363506|nr:MULTISPECIES: hypothetical protein [unclassified Streptomyces]
MSIATKPAPALISTLALVLLPLVGIAVSTDDARQTQAIADTAGDAQRYSDSAWG